MPCYGQRRTETEAERKARVSRTLATLERMLQARQVQLLIGPQGSIAFRAWPSEARDGMTDLCAFQGLRNLKSPVLARAIRAAEMRAGRPLDPQALQAGWHSHTEGVTWARH